ncbi:dipeptide ABC transporter ATP-binding protein [Rhodococcus qingshengii]|uniref:dipeptide ABC transporter ATP-binding protein n=1 Tax=Rhodococcus qingshengii TaxID=334542 RepID=UPI0036DA207A
MLVSDVNTTVRRGQTLGIVGESGSGKSMTVRSLVGLLPVGTYARGTAVFDGISLIGKRERELRAIRGSRISLLMQDPFSMLNPVQTVGEHLRETLRPEIRKGTRAQVRTEVAARLAEVGLGSDIAHKFPFQLSGGMRQRVAMAAALAGDPELLIADEPTTALDVTTQDEILQLLAGLRKSRNMALILITHDLRVAMGVCDRVQVMYAGRVVEEANATDLADAPSHPYTRGLMLANPPADRRVHRLISIPGSVPRAASVSEMCAFADRCEWSTAECYSARPALEAITIDHSSACARFDRIRDELHGSSVFEQSLASEEHSTRTIDTTGSPLVEVANLHKIYRTRAMLGKPRESHALRGVSFSVKTDESVGLVGESGSGKTTIARILLGLERSESGRVSVCDRQLAADSPPSRRTRVELAQQIQVVFQDPYASLNPARTIGAALREAISIRRRPEKVNDADEASEVAELLRKVGLPVSYANRKPSALSGGERQRAAIARAVAVQPRLLICDEPVAALDVSVQAQILELLRSIRAESGMSMLFITHDLAVVRQMTDRTIVLYRGEIVEVGNTGTVLDSPTHPYTQRLISSVPSPILTAAQRNSEPVAK